MSLFLCQYGVVVGGGNQSVLFRHTQHVEMKINMK